MGQAQGAAAARGANLATRGMSTAAKGGIIGLATLAVVGTVYVIWSIST